MAEKVVTADFVGRTEPGERPGEVSGRHGPHGEATARRLVVHNAVDLLQDSESIFPGIWFSPRRTSQKVLNTSR